MTAAEIIRHLQLEPHCEGGYFRRTYTASRKVGAPDTGGADTRPLMSSIYYLLTADTPRGRLHRNRSDIMHYWHAGGALDYYLVRPDGEMEQHTLGPDLAAGQQLQLLVPGGWWKATALADGAFGLLSEAVSPAFDDADRQLCTVKDVANAFPQHLSLLRAFCCDPLIHTSIS